MKLRGKRGRRQADDDSLPNEEGPWKYFERYLGDEEYPGYWRIPRQTIASNPAVAEMGVSKAVASTHGEQLLIDFNVESDGHDYYSPGDVEYSPDHACPAKSVDTIGAERYVVRIRHLDTGKDEDTIHDVESITWGNDR